MKFRKEAEDGRTSSEVISVHRCKQPLLCLDDTVMFRVVPDTSERHKADGAWVEGVFVGVEARSFEILLVTDGGIYKTSHHNVKRVTRERA